jgi:hypothetical protein
LSFDSE